MVVAILCAYEKPVA